jgi:hypothetical protein
LDTLTRAGDEEATAMSDERDETRRCSPLDDATQADGVPPADDRTRRVPPAPDDPTVVTPRPDATSVMPAVDDDWAAARGNPAWSGRAEVRAPQPGSTEYQEPDWAAAPLGEPRGRWWMPIAIGIVVVLLLAALAFAVYLVVQNADDCQPTAPATSAPAAPTQTTATTESTAPSTEPTTTTPTTTPPTTEPTNGNEEVTIPALKGRSLAEAQAALNRAGLSYRLLYRASDAQPNTVIDSDPAEGQEVPPDTTVTLVVAAQRTTTPTATTGAGGGGG